MLKRRLYRSRTERMVSGVSGGIADYLDVDPVLIRLLWVVTAIFSGGLTIVLYIVLWVVMPYQGYAGSSSDLMRENVAEMRTEAQRVADEIRTGWQGGPKSGDPTSRPKAEPDPVGDEPLADTIISPDRDVPRVTYIEPDDDEVRRRRTNWAGVVLVVVGGLVLINNLGGLRYIPWHLFWPATLIVIGGLLLWNRSRL